MIETMRERFENLIRDIYSEELFGKVEEDKIPKDEVMAAAMRAMAKSISHIVMPAVESEISRAYKEGYDEACSDQKITKHESKIL